MYFPIKNPFIPLQTCMVRITQENITLYQIKFIRPRLSFTPFTLLVSEQIQAWANSNVSNYNFVWVNSRQSDTIYK